MDSLVCFLFSSGSYETSPLVRTEASPHAELTNSSTTASEPAGVTGTLDSSQNVCHQNSEILMHEICAVFFFFLWPVPSQPPSDTNIVRALIAVIGMFLLYISV